MKTKPLLRINTQNISADMPKLEPMYAQIAAGSITPTTLKTRDFDSNLEDMTFRDLYSFMDKYEVNRFGLNTSSKELQNKVSDYNTTKKGQALDAKSLTSLTSQKDAVKQAQAIQEQRDAAKALLTKLEIDNSKAAIQYLNDTNSKTVLVDIFERDADNNIVLNDKNISTTHTVVLYAQDNKYLVIDPSNASFSYILMGAHDDIRVCFSNKLQIYKAPDPKAIGPNPDQGRDCVDIAVKLAFNMSVNTKLGLDSFIVKDTGNNSGYIDYDNLRNHYAIKLISNQKIAGGFTALQFTPARIKQSSDLKEVQKINVIFNVLNDMVRELDETISSLSLPHSRIKLNQLEKEIKQLLTKHCNPQEYNDHIQDFYNLTQETHEQMGVGNIKLLNGEILDIDNI